MIRIVQFIRNHFHKPHPLPTHPHGANSQHTIEVHKHRPLPIPLAVACNSHTKEIDDVAAQILQNHQHYQDYTESLQTATARAKLLVTKAKDICTTPQEVVLKALQLHEVAVNMWMSQSEHPIRFLLSSPEFYQQTINDTVTLVKTVSPSARSTQEIVTEALVIRDFSHKLLTSKHCHDSNTAVKKVVSLRNRVVSATKSHQNVDTIFKRAFLLLPYRDEKTAVEIASSDKEFLHLPKRLKQPALEIYNNASGWKAYRIHVKKIGQGGSSIVKTCIDIEKNKEHCRVSYAHSTDHTITTVLNGCRGILQIYHVSPLYLGKERKEESLPHALRRLVAKESVIEELMAGDCYNLNASVKLLQEKRLQAKVLSEKPISLTLTKAQKRDMSLDLLNGLKAMHDRKIMHNDFKPMNMLFNIDPQTQKASAVIADLERATFLPNCQLDGTPYFWAPEATMMHLGKTTTIDFAAKDVYEFSHIFLEIFADELKDSPVRKLAEISANRVTIEHPFPKTAPTKSEYDACKPLPSDPPIAHFIYKCMSLNPKDRPTATVALQEFEDLVAQGKV